MDDNDFMVCPDCNGESNRDVNVKCGTCGCAGVIPRSNVINREEFPKLFEPVPEEWKGGEAKLPDFTGFTVKKDIAAGDFRVIKDANLVDLSIDDQPGPGHGRIISVTEQFLEKFGTEGEIVIEMTEQQLAELAYPHHAPSTALANYRAGHEVWDTNGDLW
jgi:hypothetical protein